jgi:fructose-bisphosphate aldolase class II/tagatose 1,6-diphosphate aldolase GatY/KbaY
MQLQDKLLEIKHSGKAILAANFYNFETLTGILSAAAIENSPVILQLSESSIKYMGLALSANMARTALREYSVTGWLHLDHGSSLDLIHRCLDAGFDSVMIDASEETLEENIRISSHAVKLAQNYKASVEAELGYIAKLGQEFSKDAFTQPNDAAFFAKETGVNALAVAIGSAHGFYKQEPKLEIRLLSEISKATPVPLVLHGSSGIPDSMLQDAIRNGIVKINLATETKNAFMLKLQKILKDNTEIDLRKVFPPAIDEVTELIRRKIRIINNA